MGVGLAFVPNGQDSTSTLSFLPRATREGLLKKKEVRAGSSSSLSPLASFPRHHENQYHLSSQRGETQGVCEPVSRAAPLFLSGAACH